MIAPEPFKHKCLQCGSSKVVKPKSDVINSMDMINICPKYKLQMKKVPLNFIDKLFR
jgi:hypothetical protein